MLEHLKEAHAVLTEVNKAVLGKQTEIFEIMTAFLANGHVLLEDIPGVGKTTLAIAFSTAMGMDCRRVQFTPDVMPSDLTGFSVYRRDKDKFVYQPGSVFCNLLLADEINRTSPKTQSALLEVMEERKGFRRGRNTSRTLSLPCNSDSESVRHKRYTIPARSPDRPIHDKSFPRLSRSRKRTGDRAFHGRTVKDISCIACTQHGYPSGNAGGYT